MVRKTVQLATGEFYHIINRGVEQRNIFLDDDDRLRFMSSLLVFNDVKPAPWDLREFWQNNQPNIFCNYRPETPLIEIHAFVLMDNHFHLLLKQIRENGISEFMKKIGGYVSFFNKKHNRRGHLFQDRYKSVLIKTEEQLKNTFSYIHTNPVEIVEPGWKECIVKDKNKANNFVQKYRWSSYGSFIGEGEFDNVIKKDFFFNLLGGKSSIEEEVSAWIGYKAKQENLDLRGVRPRGECES